MGRPRPMPRGQFGRRALIKAATGTMLATAIRAARADIATIRIGYIHWTDPQQTISLLDKPPRDDGLAGARLAVSDNNTTGRFIGQQFELTDIPVRADDDPLSALT